ncbi:MAG: serine/threonine-protein kinase [Polyangiaceae bacterium]
MTIPFEPTTEADAQLATASTLADGFATSDTLVHDVGEAAPRIEGRARTTVVPRVDRDHSGVRLVPRTEARYRIEAVVGEGGMGEVTRAFDKDIGRSVAMKRMHDRAVSEALVARFVDEVHTLGKLQHPNIVAIHDVDVSDDGRLFFTMPLVDGRPLDAVIEDLRRGDPATVAAFPLSKRLDVFAGVVDALGHAHARDVVHRDVKPANIMVGPYGEVVLLDWGIARLGASETDDPRGEPEGAAASGRRATAHGQVLGTPGYMAPEQARGDVSAIGPATDLFAAFVTLYELLTLAPYVKADTVEGALAEIAAKPAPPIHDPAYLPEGHPAVPAEIRHFLRHGLAPSPDLRYPSAADVLATLAAIRSGDFRVECPVTFSKKLGTELFRFMDRRPRTALALLAATPLAFVLALVTLAFVLLAR